MDTFFNTTAHSICFTPDLTTASHLLTNATTGSSGQLFVKGPSSIQFELGVDANPVVHFEGETLLERLLEFHGYYLPGVKRVHFNGDKCIVLWEDGDKTVVTCGKGETFDRYTGFIAAVAKKLFGGTTAAKKLLDEKDADFQAQCQAEKEIKEKQRRIKEDKERAQRAHERKVKAYAKKILVEREALELLNRDDYTPKHAKKEA